MAGSRRVRAVGTSADQSVTTLELFFDLVFVFALTQLTELMAHDLSWRGVVRGAFLLGLLWWSWAAYSWVCNIAKADEGAVRTVLLGAMAAMFVIALAVPEAFDDLPGGLSGPVVIAIAYFVLRAIHLVLLWLIAEGDQVLRRTIAFFAIGKVGAAALLLVASQYHGITQTLLWAGALAADYVSTYLVDARGWRFNSPAHWAERHGLIIIIALGESIVEIGVGVTALPISWPILAASLPGIVLLALGLKKILEYVGEDLARPLHGIGLFALYVGTALYLAGLAAFKRRAIHHWSLPRLITAAVLLVAVPLVRGVPALAQLLVLTVALTALVITESRTSSRV
ncbi:low temperature requirement protein A [Kribbella jejuensis]|nr:low temperature requirement protein A [Kribbella jejuensis]